MSIMALDLDRFKRINDQFGHDMGDQALIAFAQLLKSLCRKSDLIFRTGGEEFLIVLPRTTTPIARHIANRILREVRALEIAPGVSFTVSIGVAPLLTEENGAQLLKRADSHLYQAKSGGRDQVSTASCA